MKKPTSRCITRPAASHARLFFVENRSFFRPRWTRILLAGQQKPSSQDCWLLEICFIFGYFVALTTPRPLDHGNETCVSKLQKRAKELCETYKEGTKVNKSVVKEIHKTIAAVLPNKLPDCSQNKHTDLDFIVAYNTLFISIANHSHTSLKDPVETKLLTVIGQQSVCLSNHRKSETNNLTIDFNPPPLSEIVHLKLIYYHLFESFKTCMDQLSRTV